MHKKSESIHKLGVSMHFIYSSGGFAREFVRIWRESDSSISPVFIDDAPESMAISLEEAIALRGEASADVVVGFANAIIRRKKTELVEEHGFSVASVKASTAIVGDKVDLGSGYVLSDFTMLTADATVGKSFHANIYSYVAHDCVVGDYVTLAPRAAVNGRVEIEDNVYIGTGATILPGKKGSPIKIGKGAVIGAHALVTGDVPPNAVMIGTPAKPK